MLKNQKKETCNSYKNIKILHDYNISNNSYLETIEFKTIKKLLCEDNLEYITDSLRDLLKVSKLNNPDCFRKNMLNSTYHTLGKRGIIYTRLSQEDLDKEEFREYKAFKTFFGQYKLFNK